jgi:hypothetical protein
MHDRDICLQCSLPSFSVWEERAMSDLDKLIDAVEPGEWATGLTLPYDLHTDLTWKAFHGSLDAAKALHDALLPGADANIENDGCVCVWDSDGKDSHARIDGNPARAWLLAILRAYRETQP